MEQLWLKLIHIYYISYQVWSSCHWFSIHIVCVLIVLNHRNPEKNIPKLKWLRHLIFKDMGKLTEINVWIMMRELNLCNYSLYAHDTIILAQIVLEILGERLQFSIEFCSLPRSTFCLRILRQLRSKPVDKKSTLVNCKTHDI